MDKGVETKSMFRKMSEKITTYFKSSASDIGSEGLAGGNERNNDKGFGKKEMSGYKNPERLAKNIGASDRVKGVGQNKDGRIGNRDVVINQKMVTHSQNLAKNIGALARVKDVEDRNEQNGIAEVKSEKKENAQERNLERRQHVMRKMIGCDY